MLYHLQSFHVDWHLQTGMCQTMVQECTALCANTNCWPLCSCQLQLPDSIPPLSWSGLLSRERAPWFWTCTHSTVRWTGGSMEAVCANPDVHLNYLPPSPFFFFFFFLRWNADKWSGVMDHRRAAGLVASSLQVTPLYVQCVYLPSIYNNVAYDCLCVGMSQRCDRGCPGLDSITSDRWRLVRSSRFRLCHGSSGCSRSGRNATNMDSPISLI